MESNTGTPQGGPLSPLLANIALSALDEHFDQQWRQMMGTDYQRASRRKNALGNWRLIRHADDFVVMVRGERRHAEALRGGGGSRARTAGVTAGAGEDPRGPHR